MSNDYESTPSQYGTNTYGTSQYGLGDYVSSEGSPFIVHQVNVVKPDTAVLVPEGKNVWNQFDEHGLVVGLPRLKKEKNSEYSRRIKDVFVNRSNSAYRGLINGITRELGLSLFQPISINPKVSIYSGNFLAPDPYIKFDGAHLYLYSDYRNNVLDHKIDRYEPGGNYEHIYRLVDFINQTTYFEASIESGYDEYIKSMTILNQSNRQTVQIEDAQISTKFLLDNKYIVPKSLLTNEPDIVNTEVSDEISVSRKGHYWLDYAKGLIRLYSTPTIGTAFKYEYNVYPFKPIASPVILHDINDEDFRIKMFNQVLDDTGKYVHGTPTELGVDIVNELMSVTPMYWGR
jgi:hypothetical protein